MATPGWVGLLPTKAIVSYDGTSNRFPGHDIDGSEKRFCSYTAGPFQHSPNSVQLAKVSNDGRTWGPPVTIRAAPANYFSNGAEVTFVPALGFVLVYNEQSDDGAHDDNYIIICTVDGSNVVTVGSPVLIPIPSGWKWISTIGKLVVLPNGHFMLPIYGQINAHSGSVTDAAMLFNTDGTATTWGGLVMLATGDATNYWSESGSVVIPVGYPNAGRVVTFLRNDDNSNVNSGYYRLESDTPETLFSQPVKVLAELSAYVGKPAPTFVPKGAYGGIFLGLRWQPTDSPFYVANSFTGYTISWDQGVTLLPMRNYSPGSTLIQNWYSSGAYIPSTGNVECAIGLAFNNVSSVAWVVCQEYETRAPA